MTVPPRIILNVTSALKGSAVNASFILALLNPTAAFTQVKQPPSGTGREWVARSNAYTQKLIDLDLKYNPEAGSQQGIAKYDTLIAVPTRENDLALRKEEEALVRTFATAGASEPESQVKQDLTILTNNLTLAFAQEDFQLKRKVPYLSAASLIYNGLQMLLDDQTPPERRQAAVVRLQKYAGLDKRYRPLTATLEERVKEQEALPNVLYPSRQEIELELSRSKSIMAGIPLLCQKYKLKDYEAPYAALKKQVEQYDQWTRDNLLPGSRVDFRLPPEEYELAFKQYGIDITPSQIALLAHAAFTDIQNQMQGIAKQIATQRHLSSSDYRFVIADLKKHQVHGDSIMTLYKKHLADIEEIIRKQHLVTLPSRPAIIRLATEAETALQPAPHMSPPPFLNNTGERGVFVLPLNMPPAQGEKAGKKYDDFTFEAASWTLIAHEARPGHELQFDKMVEEGVSLARVLYAFNSTNVEGWGLYSEYITRPYMPLEGQLVSLDYRLLRAARAFLDPELQAGKLTQQQALDILMKDVVQSPAMAQQEVERYTVQAPGQANSYFYGFTKMLALRADTEKALGTKFNQLNFHDFILAQGLLPPALIRSAVLKEFVPSQLSQAAPTSGTQN